MSQALECRHLAFSLSVYKDITGRSIYKFLINEIVLNNDFLFIYFLKKIKGRLIMLDIPVTIEESHTWECLKQLPSFRRH